MKGVRTTAPRCDVHPITILTNYIMDVLRIQLLLTKT